MAVAVVTGGTGFVGANLSRALLDAGHQVHLLVREGYSSWRLAPILKDISLHQVDLEDIEGLKTSFRLIKPDWIFHLAVHGAYSWQKEMPSILQTNLIGTMNLLNAALETGFEAFVNTGSSSEYGHKDHAPAETEFLEPNSDYAVMKAAATMYCGYVAKRDSLYVPSLRLYSVYGAWEEPRRLIPNLLMHGLRGSYPPLVNPEIARDFIHVEDVNAAFLCVVKAANSELSPIYNLGTGQQVQLKDIVALVRQLLDIKAEPSWGTMPNRDWDTSIWLANIEKLQTAYNWQAEVSLRDGLERTISWLQTNPDIQAFYARQIFPND